MNRAQRTRRRRCINRGHDLPDPSTLRPYFWGSDDEPHVRFRCGRCGRQVYVTRPRPPAHPSTAIRDAVNAAYRQLGRMP